MSTSAWGVDHGSAVSKRAPEDMTRRQQLGRNRRVTQQHQKKESGKAAWAGLAGGAAVGVGLRNSRAISYGARATGKFYREGNSAKNSVRAGRNMAGWTRRVVDQKSTTNNLLAATYGGFYGSVAGSIAGQRRGTKKAKKDPRYIHNLKPLASGQ